MSGELLQQQRDFVPAAARAALPPRGLAPGDRVSVEYTRVPATSDQPYKLQEGDQLRIAVASREDLGRTVVIAPDGSMSYPYVGRIRAAGRSLQEIEQELDRALGEALERESLQVDVLLESAGSRLDDFLELLLGATAGSVRELAVDQNGELSLPGVGRLSALGQTTGELEGQIQERLSASYPDLSVVVNALQVVRSEVTVMGEVLVPGRYPMAPGLSLLEGLALAGGQSPVADLRRVLLFEHNENGPAIARVYDVDRALANGDSMSSIHLRPQDLLLVPRTGVGDVNLWVDQYLRRNMPINFSFGYRIE